MPMHGLDHDGPSTAGCFVDTSPDRCIHTLVVRMPELSPSMRPWIRITADKITGEITVASAVRAALPTHDETDDGA